MALVGPNSFFRLRRILKSAVLERPVGVTLLEDNQTTATHTRTVNFPKLRHVQRMHGVDIRWMYDGIQRDVFNVRDRHTQRMSGDILIKRFTVNGSWEHAIRLLGFRGADFSKVIQDSHVVTYPPTTAPFLSGPNTRQSIPEPTPQHPVSLTYSVAACISRVDHAQPVTGRVRESEETRKMQPASSNPNTEAAEIEEQVGGQLGIVSNSGSMDEGNPEMDEYQGVPCSDPLLPPPYDSIPQDPGDLNPIAKSPPPKGNKGSPKSVPGSPPYLVSSPGSGKGKGKPLDAAAEAWGEIAIRSQRIADLYTTEAAQQGRGRWTKGKGVGKVDPASEPNYSVEEGASLYPGDYEMEEAPERDQQTEADENPQSETATGSGERKGGAKGEGSGDLTAWQQDAEPLGGSGSNLPEPEREEANSASVEAEDVVMVEKSQDAPKVKSPNPLPLSSQPEQPPITVGDHRMDSQRQWKHGQHGAGRILG